MKWWGNGEEERHLGFHCGFLSSATPKKKSPVDQQSTLEGALKYAMQSTMHDARRTDVKCLNLGRSTAAKVEESTSAHGMPIQVLSLTLDSPTTITGFNKAGNGE